MKKIIIAAIFFASCSTPQHDSSIEATEQIRKADIEMSGLAAKIGFRQALLQYADDSLIIPGEGKLPLIGKAAVEKAWAKKDTIKDVIWKPVRAEASQSGEMGYSFGYAIWHWKDTTTYSNYCTVWKKQKDGSWKFVYDAGNNIPAPADTSFFK